jgi:hypothetical protein
MSDAALQAARRSFIRFVRSVEPQGRGTRKPLVACLPILP